MIRKPRKEKPVVVEDEQHLAEGLRFNLEAEGFRVVAPDSILADTLAPSGPIAASGELKPI